MKIYLKIQIKEIEGFRAYSTHSTTHATACRVSFEDPDQDCSFGHLKLDCLVLSNKSTGNHRIIVYHLLRSLVRVTKNKGPLVLTRLLGEMRTLLVATTTVYTAPPTQALPRDYHNQQYVQLFDLTTTSNTYSFFRDYQG
jgi:hypothetical protein